MFGPRQRAAGRAYFVDLQWLSDCRSNKDRSLNRATTTSEPGIAGKFHRQSNSGLHPAARVAIAAHVMNELRGGALAVPVLLAMYRSGGAWMAIWLGICSIVGIAITVSA